MVNRGEEKVRVHMNAAQHLKCFVAPVAKRGNIVSENKGSLIRIIINRLSKKSGETSVFPFFLLQGLFPHKL